MIKGYNVDLSTPQSDFFISRQPSVAVIAGYGSGKTFTLWMKLWHWMCEYPGVMHGYFAPTHGLIRDILYPLVESWCDAAGVAYTIKQDKGIIYVHGLGSIICRSMERPERIVGFEIGHAAVDEIDILPTEKAWHAWRKIRARCRITLRDKNGVEVNNQMALASTPEGYKMAYQAFKKDPIPNSQLISMSTYSNQKNLPKNYIQDLLDNYPAQLVEAYIMGQFTNLNAGSVYPSFSRFFNNAPGVIPNKREALYVGMDFNLQHMSAVVHIIRSLRPVAVGELVDLSDTPTMIKSLKDLYRGHPITIYPDASSSHGSTIAVGVSDLKLLTSAGFYVKVNPANPRVRDRVNSMNAMLLNAMGERKYMVNVDECPHYADCLEQQPYDKNGIPDKKSGLDHLPDAGGYFIEREFGLSKPSSQTGRLIM